MMNTKGYLAVAFAALIGVLAGWLLRGPGGKETIVDQEEASLRPTSRHRSDSSPSSDGSRSSRNAARRGGKESDGVDDEELHVDSVTVAALLESKVVDLELRTDLVSSSEPLARFLRLSDEESKELNDLWKNVSPKLNAIRTENVQHQTLDDGSMWIGVSTFPEKGDELRRDFILTTLGVLGESRGKVFLDALKAHGAFGQWGKTVSGFAIKVRVQDNGEHLYEITEQTTADGKPGRKWQTSRVPAHLEDMAKAAGIALSP